MEETIRPDKKFLTKSLWVHLTASVSLVVLLGVIHLIVYLAGGDPAAPPILWGIGWGVIVIGWSVVFPLVQLWIRRLSYTIYDDRVTIHKGILTKTQQNIPFRSVTDFALRRTLFDRALGIGSVRIQTAGQSHNPSGYEGSLMGIQEYEALHANLKDRIRSLHPRSEAVATFEPTSAPQSNALGEILKEVRSIRKLLGKKRR